MATVFSCCSLSGNVQVFRSIMNEENEVRESDIREHPIHHLPAFHLLQNPDDVDFC